MISLMNYAWDQRQKVDAATYQDQCRNLLSHAYADLTNMYNDYCVRQNVKNEDLIFYTFQEIFVFIMLSDGDFLQGEYDAVKMTGLYDTIFFGYDKWMNEGVLVLNETPSVKRKAVMRGWMLKPEKYEKLYYA